MRMNLRDTVPILPGKGQGSIPEEHCHIKRHFSEEKRGPFHRIFLKRGFQVHEQKFKGPEANIILEI